MTSLKTSIKTITYLSDIGCLEIQGASLEAQEYGSVVEKYKKDIDMYNKEKAKGNTEVSPPVKPEGYDEKSKRHADVTTRDKNEKSGGGPIAPNGAWHMPRTGDSPKGLKSGLQDYQPEEWVQ